MVIGVHVRSNDFSRCQECYGFCHNTSNQRVHLLSVWELEAERDIGALLGFSQVTRQRLKSLLRTKEDND
ncbi:MAG: hypothetical protein ACRC8Y_24845 [Chroococcales cyanobacterium]